MSSLWPAVIAGLMFIVVLLKPWYSPFEITMVNIGLYYLLAFLPAAALILIMVRYTNSRSAQIHTEKPP